MRTTSIRRAGLLLATAFALLVGGVALRTARSGSPEVPVSPAPEIAIPPGAAERLAGSLRFPTMSTEEPYSFPGEAFEGLHAYLQATFPLAHAELGRELVGGHSLLYTWQGTDASLRPIMLAGHLDVVPIEPGTEAEWQHDPFAGRIADGFVWGRGAIDNKSAIAGTLEAVEVLLRERFRPARTVYLAFGHDEEVGGTQGARQIAALLKSRGVELEMVLDEGGVIGDSLLPGISGPVALVGIAEKGFATLELSVRLAGGHSSLPPKQTAIGVLAAAVATLERNQMPARLDGATRQLFDTIGPRFPPLQRAVFANLWLTTPFVLRTLEAQATTRAMIRTTMAPTIFRAGTKDNVLPASAQALVNFRLVPGDSVSGVLDHVRRVVSDPRVDVNLAGRFSAEPSAVSSVHSRSFRAIEMAIRRVAPEVVVAPYLVVVATDSRYYSSVSRQVYRFLPLRLTSGDLGRMHGIDERIGIREYEEAIRLYRELIATASAPS